jgi:hypothetical protein
MRTNGIPDKKFRGIKVSLIGRNKLSNVTIKSNIRKVIRRNSF